MELDVLGCLENGVYDLLSRSGPGVLNGLQR